MACNWLSSLCAQILLLLTLTHSLTQTNGIVAYASLGSKLQKRKQKHIHVRVMELSGEVVFTN